MSSSKAQLSNKSGKSGEKLRSREGSKTKRSASKNLSTSLETVEEKEEDGTVVTEPSLVEIRQLERPNSALYCNIPLVLDSYYCHPVVADLSDR